MSTNITASSEAAGEVKRYLRVVLLSNDRGLIYRKDFDPRNVFEEFLRSLVSDLILEGLVEEGDFYSALIIPRYGTTMILHSLIVYESAGGGEKRPWISLEFEEEVDPDNPVKYFTVELHVRDNALVYRKDFQMHSLNHFFRRIEPALVKLGALSVGDTYIRQIFAREDDGAEMGRDEIYALKEEANSLVELSPTDETREDFPRRELSEFEVVETVGEVPPQGSIQVLVTRPALTAVEAIARGGAAVEVGGYLVGKVYQGTDPAGQLVEISDHIFAEKALGSEVELRFTFESWQKAASELKEKFPDRRIVGWYHTHLIKAEFLDAMGQAVQATEHFFSVSDHFMHRQFFPDKWYVAMVLNPRGEAAFFQWRGNDIIRAPGFHVTHA